MAFLNQTEALAAVARLLKTDVSALGDDWQGITADAMVFAESEIVSRLIARGYTTEQVNAWDHRKAFALRLTTFLALTAGGALGSYDAELLKTLDCRPTLDCLTLSIGGKYVVPGQGAAGAGTASYGEVDTSTDLFRMDDSDPRRGEITRF